VKRLALIFTLAIIASFVAVPSAFAFATTDLNNIPITDTLKEGTMEWDVLAAYNQNFTRGRHISTRLFTSLFENFEFGMSWNISRPAGPVEMAVKYKVLDEYHGFPVSLAIGADRITGNYQRTHYNPTYYAVVGIHDVHIIGWWDWYAGIAVNPLGVYNTDKQFFGGFKYWINDDWQFNADYYGYKDPLDDSSQSIITAGVNYDWVNHIGFQAWVERDSELVDLADDPTSGIDNPYVFVLQLTVRGDMRDLHAEVSDPE